MAHHLEGGVIAIEDGIKRQEEYAPPRKVKVELRFAIPEDADAHAHIAGVADLAHAHVQRLLHGTNAPVQAQTAAPAAEKPKATRTGAKAAAAEAKPALAKPPADELDAETAKPAGATSAEEFPEEDFNAPIPPTAEPPRPITDAELNSRVQDVNAKIKNPTAIRGLIAAYNPDPTKLFTLREIAQADRAGFLEKLAALA